MKYFSIFFILLCSVISIAQEQPLSFKSVRAKTKKKDSIPFVANDYKIISISHDTISIDTTLTIDNAYKHNPIGKDLFAYMPLSNMGQGYNTLVYDVLQGENRPEMGALANALYHIKTKDVPYYSLPTPITEFMYKTGMEQGQTLQSLFSVNVREHLNVFLRYNALRSLGNYQQLLSSVGNFIGGLSYQSPNKRYWVLTHYTNEDIFRQENGGIALKDQFESGDPQFDNRALIDVRLSDVETTQEITRYFFTHQYNFLRPDSRINKHILVKQAIEYQRQSYLFKQTQSNELFGQSYIPSEIKDKYQLRTLIHTIGAELILPYLGQSFIYGKSYHYQYLFKGLRFDNQGHPIAHQIKGTDYAIGLQWQKHYKGLHLNAQGEQQLSAKLLGTDLMGKITYNFSPKTRLTAGVKLLSVMPNFNKLLHQSSYKAYNWYKLDTFQRENTQTLFGEFSSKRFDTQVQLSNLNHYTYFKATAPEKHFLTGVTPVQYTGNIQHLKAQASTHWQWRKWGLRNTLAYQQVIQNESVLNVPAFVGRHTLYFATELFNKAMYLQTGLTLKYFTPYYANGYNPLLAEFQPQNQQRIGGFAMGDFFINAKVRTMRIFVALEHFNAGYSGHTYYSAPEQPYRDRIIRFGILWNFFN